MNRQSMQNQQYSFPYHYIPYCDSSKQVWRWRSLRWGFEYWCYMMHIKQRILETSAGNWLDVGCGDGRLISLLAEEKNIAVTGVDLCAEAVDHARAFNPGKRFICGNTRDVNDSFDLVTAVEVLEHIEDSELEVFIREICSRLNCGGRLLIGVPSINKPLAAKHYRHYDEKLLLEHIKPEENGLQTEQIEYLFAGNDLLYSLYTKLTDNRFWFIGIRFFERLVWRYTWKNLRKTTPDKAFHILISLKKAD